MSGEKVVVKGKLLDGRTLQEKYPVKCVGDIVEIELPPVNPEELKEGMTVLVKVVLKGYCISDNGFCFVPQVNAPLNIVNVNNIVSILPETREEKIEKQEIDFEGLKIKGQPNSSSHNNLVDLVSKLFDEVSEIKRRVR